MKPNLVLESSALWNLYYQEKGAELIEMIIEKRDFECYTSRWSTLELFRGIKKRLNQQEISLQEAIDLRDFIEADLLELEFANKLKFIEIHQNIIEISNDLIFEKNLYAADALHLASAITTSSNGILVDDYHFKRLSKEIEQDYDLKIIPTTIAIDSIYDFI